MTLRVALVAGPMYDHLYDVFDAAGLDVEIVVHADHPTLNREVARLLGAGERIDLLSTHSKYAPSQAHWLRPLDPLVDPSSIAELSPGAVELCRHDDTWFCLPRLTDVRIMWCRTDRVDPVPDTWDELLAGPTVFGFPGRESGLFGTFFELVVGNGGRLFDDDDRPCLDNAEGVAALEILRQLTARAPSDLPGWHYDDVDAALLDGRIDAAGTWPGAWGAINDSAIRDRLAPHPYPAGSIRRVSYAGCHAWAVPTSCGDLDGALEALHTLLGMEAQALDASGGSFCAHEAALRSVAPIDDLDRRRREITQATIADAMITYPPHPRFPGVEDAGWSAVRSAMTGESSPDLALRTLQALAIELLDHPHDPDGDTITSTETEE